MKRILIVIGCLLFGCSVSSSSPPDTGARHLSKRSFDSSNLDVASFAQSVFFNTVGSSIPLGWFLSSVINLFKSGFKGESILEKLRKEIKSAVLKGVTDYHQDQLYNQILSINSTMDGIYPEERAGKLQAEADRAERRPVQHEAHVLSSKL